MTGALHAEWTKLRTVASTGWLLLGVIAATVALSATAAAARSCGPAAGCHPDLTRLSLTGIGLGQAIVVTVAVLAVSGEYATGMIRTTLAAVPRRAVVLGAKAMVVTAGVLAAGALAVSGSLLAGRLILPGHGFSPAHGYPDLSLGSGPVLRAAAGSVLYLALIASAQPGCGHRGAGGRGGHRDRPRPAVPVPHPRAGGRQPGLAPAPGSDRADDRRAGDPGQHRPARPADRPVGRAGRAGRLGGGGAAGRRPDAAPAGCLRQAVGRPGRRRVRRSGSRSRGR